MTLPWVLDPAGETAVPVALLSWILFGGGALILLLVLGMIAVALWGPHAWRARLGREGVVSGLGLVFPIAVLTLLLVVGLTMTRSLASSTLPEGALEIAVEGELYWWRITYPGFETANELVIPVGRPVHLRLESDNVIHSFWVPQLGGKRDMIPGKDNRLNLVADRPGTYYGLCTEYCGGAHALMQFRVHALPPAEYARWEANQRSAPAAPQSERARRGAELFDELGCARCHAVGNAGEAELRGPSLAHLAARSTIGAGVLPLSEDNLTRWTRATDRVKPGNLMPAYPYLPEDDAAAISAYLLGLE